jgi:superfamily II DNA or RNA helicase
LCKRICNFLTHPQDQRIAQTIETYETKSWGRYIDISYSLGGIDALRALAGHPALFRNPDDPVPVELVFLEPRLVVDEAQGKLRLSLFPENMSREYTVVEAGPHRIEVYTLTSPQEQVAKIIDGGASVPFSARRRVEETVAALASIITIQSDIAATDAGAIRSMTANDRLHLLLTRRGESLEVRPQVFPLGSDGPSCVPGQGQRLVVANVQGERLQAARDLDAEQRRLDAFVSRCPSLEQTFSDGACWQFNERDDGLAFLLELKRIDDHDLSVDWSAEGPRFDVTRELDVSALDLAVRGVTEGFSIEGTLRVDEERSLPLPELFSLLEASPARFFAQPDGCFIALTEEFRRRLARLARYTWAGGKTLRISALAAPAVEPLFNLTGTLRADASWNALVERIRAAETQDTAIPSTLKAELRPYQQDGFRWMAQLSAWGAGACLADDMGLGKTVQALALALVRASLGPTLVIAPKSVCNNWLAEAARFAPTLNVRRFGGGDRRQMIAQLGPHDLLVASYGLLKRESTLLQDVEWSMVVLDEAQAIKNPRTTRFKAALQLRSGFRLATTGTPIENRLEELWSIFQFLNPGLLGALADFERRFATPIERDRDREARRDLRRLVLPFIMRRTKGEVLDDLPPCTEIDLRLKMSPTEAALYEALRQQALGELTGGGAIDGADPIKVLAWITKLRQVCCNPRLVVTDGQAPQSCKLSAFQELVEELLASGHKALVFSQFVGHLAILREWLDQQGIVYQYLDGQTEAHERTRRIDAFQAGEGVLFLLSLRAGGLGLNLTAADYVIHLDPWWNPAVEDQASSRAHRLGQSRPVTVYRLIAADTIEERIIALHRHKRDLAEQLLQGADAAGRLSAAELLELLQR